MNIEQKRFTATPQGQKVMCHNGFISATSAGLAKLIAKLQKDRHSLVAAWRAGGKTDELWAAVDALDVVIARQEETILTLEEHRKDVS